jgi:glycosyltransferase involved in cell wall biosynthesis
LNESVPSVSVVVPFHNPGTFLRDAIESVLTQTFNSWELLLVDDGSTDGSSDIAREYVRLHPDRISYLGHSGGQAMGASHARNVGLRHARGEFLASLDADDVWLPHKLEEQVALLSAHPVAGAIYGRTIYWHSWRAGVGSDRDLTPETGFENGGVVPPPLLIEEMLEGNAPMPCTCSILVRRSAAERVGGYEEQFPRMYDDQVFYTKLFLDVPGLVIDRTWDMYRQHDRSMTATARHDPAVLAERLRFLDWAAQYMETRGLRGSRAWKTVQRTRLSLRYPRPMRLVRLGIRAARAVADFVLRRGRSVSA